MNVETSYNFSIGYSYNDGLDILKIETYYKFAKDIENIKHNSLKKINSIISENKKIIGYGAPAKATTVLNYFGINSDHFEYIVDDNHLKHNLYVPETGIKIIESDTINPDDYDFVLVLAWNFFDSIKKQQKKLFNKSSFIKLK